jgi:type-F conjugative transfer system pilin assembly protein TrbC
MSQSMKKNNMNLGLVIFILGTVIIGSLASKGAGADQSVVVKPAPTLVPAVPSTLMPDSGAIDEAAKKAEEVLNARELTPEVWQGQVRNLDMMPQIGNNQSSVLDKLLGRDMLQKPAPQQTEALFVLVSFSMPEQALINLANQATKVGAPLVIRGLVNDSLPDTAKAIAKLAKSNPNLSVQINPNLFKWYGIKSVPAFVLARPIDPMATDDQVCNWGTDFVAVRGDVTLSYAVQKLGEHAEWKEVADRYLNMEKNKK